MAEGHQVNTCVLLAELTRKICRQLSSTVIVNLCSKPTITFRQIHIESQRYA